MNVSSLATSLLEEARRSNERRLLVLAGNRERGYETARDALAGAGIPAETTTQVGPRQVLDCEQVSNVAPEPPRNDSRGLVFDAHDELRPDAFGRVVGAVDGGGLFVLLTPPSIPCRPAGTTSTRRWRCRRSKSRT